MTYFACSFKQVVEHLSGKSLEGFFGTFNLVLSNTLQNFSREHM